MKNEMIQAMEIVAPRILEEAAFLFSESIDTTEVEPHLGDPVGVELRWSGPTSGVMRFWTERSLLPILASNMLGVDENDPVCEQKGMDALKETLNMIVGNSLTEAFGPGPVFPLDIPRTVAIDFLEVDKPNGLWLSTEGTPVLLWTGV